MDSPNQSETLTIRYIQFLLIFRSIFQSNLCAHKQNYFESRKNIFCLQMNLTEKWALKPVINELHEIKRSHNQRTTSMKQEIHT